MLMRAAVLLSQRASGAEAAPVKNTVLGLFFDPLGIASSCFEPQFCFKKLVSLFFVAFRGLCFYHLSQRHVIKMAKAG